MTEQEKRKGGGAKLSRSETVTVRLDPKLRYIAELAARRQRRTLSSFIEWSVEKALGDVTLRSEGDWRTTLLDVAPKLWAINPAERFLRLVDQFPELMSYEEEVIWNAITTVTAYESWKDQQGKSEIRTASFMYGPDNKKVPDAELIQKCWKELTGYASGERSEAELKKALLLHDDIPF